jgi:Pyruvate/2-oxoglutarate dehydrogenase complex, dihydrolipoamide dehydrogenase (E3) component, and related enzymes
MSSATPETTVDIVVLGMGPGGESAAERLAASGLSVIGIDANLVGGECPYYGCIPSKMMIRAADSLAEAGRVGQLAGSSHVEPSFSPVATRIRDEATDNWDDRVAVERFEKAGGTFVRGRGTVAGPRTVQVGDRSFTASQALVVNTGTDPAIPPIPGLSETPYWTNREVVRISEAPESLIVLGGGAIGAEIAQALARFGTRVAIVEMAPRLLPLDEPEAGRLLAEVFAREGIVVHTGTGATGVRHTDGVFTVETGAESLTAERLLVATGRRIDLAGLGLGSVGVDTTQRFVDPDEYLRIADGVYAIGDITGKGGFTHISMYQAGIVTDHILGREPAPAEYHAVPRVTFTDPEIGAVGLTEEQAEQRGIRTVSSLSLVSSSTRGWIHKAGNDGFVKLVADADRGILVGATSAGPYGGEVLSILTLAVHERTPLARLRSMIYAYPTFHRGIEDALAQLEA